jgi:Ca2+-binding RTX toxin-like protein
MLSSAFTASKKISQDNDETADSGLDPIAAATAADSALFIAGLTQGAASVTPPQAVSGGIGEIADAPQSGPLLFNGTQLIADTGAPAAAVPGAGELLSPGTPLFDAGLSGAGAAIVAGSAPQQGAALSSGNESLVSVPADMLVTSGIGEQMSEGLTSTAPSDLVTYAIGEVYTGDPLPGAQTQQSKSLIDWDDFTANALYSGINGTGVTVAILDTGADLNHSYFGPDSNSDGIADRIVYQYDFINGDNNAEDGNGHGTNVAGIVGSSNATYTGMATGVNFIVLKVLDDAGSGTGTALENALQWLVTNGAAYNLVSVNMSLGFGENSNANHNWFLTDEIQALYNQGVAVVSAAGNDYYDYQAQGVDYPGSDPYSWAVGAVYDSDVGGRSYSSGAIDYTSGADRLTAFSQRSTTQTDIFAPGAIITNAGPNGTTVGYSGTSQATPHIAGIVALMQDLSLEISGQKIAVDTLRTLMRNSAVSIYDGVTNTNQNYLRVDVDGFAAQVVQYWQTATSGNDTLYGWRGDDIILAQDGADTIYGNNGNDTLEGGIGNDTIYGGANDDLIRGGDNDDLLYGGTGNDRMGGKNGIDYIYGEDGDDQLWGDAGNDTLEGGLGNDLINGGDDNDLLRGNGGNDTLRGGNGDDRIGGKDGEDAIFGDVGNDQIWGDAGNDTINGGVGNDTMIGGVGNDTFVVATSWGADTINGWENGVDRLDFTALAGSGVHSAANLTIQIQGANTVIAWSGNQITLTGFNGSLNTSNWLFA